MTNLEPEEESSFFERFLQRAADDISRLVDQVFGGSYKAKYQFTWQQRKKIMDYLFRKNITDSIELNNKKVKKHFEEIPEEESDNIQKNLAVQKRKLENSKDKLDNLKLQREFLRNYFVNEMSYEMNRSRYVSMAYGFLFGTFINLTLTRFSSHTRKAFVCLFFSHIFGQTSVRRNSSYAFDRLYPIFREDAQKLIKNNQLEQFSDQDLKKLAEKLNL